jgi:hypothetical protein
MLNVLEASWDAGLVGFEEVSIPVLCLATPGCTLGQLGERERVTGEMPGRLKLSLTQVDPSSPPATHTCEAFLQARRLRTHELWHPIKNRTCLAARISRDNNEPWRPVSERRSRHMECSEPLWWQCYGKRKRMCPWCASGRM